LPRHGRKPCQPLCRDRQAILADVEHNEPVEGSVPRAVDEQAGPDPRLEMIGREICLIELRQLFVGQRQANRFESPWTTRS